VAIVHLDACTDGAHGAYSSSRSSAHRPNARAAPCLMRCGFVVSASLVASNRPVRKVSYSERAVTEAGRPDGAVVAILGAKAHANYLRGSSVNRAATCERESKNVAWHCSANYSCPSFDWRAAQLAVQRRLGSGSCGHSWCGSGCGAHSCATRSILVICGGSPEFDSALRCLAFIVDVRPDTRVGGQGS
jgi:hypothetical protein